MASILRSAMFQRIWLQPLIEGAKKVVVDDVDAGFIERRSIKKINVYALRSFMDEHTDEEFPQWTYLLILRADKRAVLRCEDCMPAVLRPGMIIEFDSHKIHSLEQSQISNLVWINLDSEERLTIQEAYKKHKTAIRKILK